MLKKCFFLYTDFTNLACINSYFEVYLALQCLHLQNSKINKITMHYITLYISSHSKHMITDGTCHIVEDNIGFSKTHCDMDL